MLILYLIACIFLFSVLYYMSISVLMEFQIHSKKKKGLWRVLCFNLWSTDAVGRGDVWRTPLPARPVASRHVMPRGFWSVLADSSRLELYRPIRPIQAEIPKKNVRNAPFKPNIKPYFQLTSHKHTKQAFCLSLTPSLVSHSLCLFLCLLWNTQPMPS